jgi:hypothetical protein
MNQLVPIRGAAVPVPPLITAAGERASRRFLEVFAANIRNPHTRRAYYRATDEFLAWCASADAIRSASMKSSGSSFDQLAFQH